MKAQCLYITNLSIMKLNNHRLLKWLWKESLTVALVNGYVNIQVVETCLRTTSLFKTIEYSDIVCQCVSYDHDTWDP